MSARFGALSISDGSGSTRRVSVVSTLVTQVVLFLTYHAWNLGPAWVCNVIATVVASIPAYYLNRTWTWGKRGRSRAAGGRSCPSGLSPSSPWCCRQPPSVWRTHYADQSPRGSLDRALVINGANLITYAVMWTARYFVLNRFLFGTRSPPPASSGRGRPERAAGERAIGERGPPAASARSGNDLSKLATGGELDMARLEWVASMCLTGTTWRAVSTKTSGPTPSEAPTRPTSGRIVAETVVDGRPVAKRHDGAEYRRAESAVCCEHIAPVVDDGRVAGRRRLQQGHDPPRSPAGARRRSPGRAPVRSNRTTYWWARRGARPRP